MSDQRFIIEMGMGNDLYGQDYTKAATLPRGCATVTAVKGGLNVTNPDTGNVTVIASALIGTFLPPQHQAWQEIIGV